jgi:hypothetical protein
VAAVDFVRAVADLDSVGAWFAGTVIGIVAVLMIFVGVTLAGALMAKNSEQQLYMLGLLREILKFALDMVREFLQFTVNLIRGRGKP